MIQGTGDISYTKKAFEISYALFRLAGALPKRGFADLLEANAALMLEATARGDWGRAEATTRALEQLVRLGGELNFIHPENAELLMQEFGNFNAAIAGFSNPAKLQDLEKVFSNNSIKNTKELENKDALKEQEQSRDNLFEKAATAEMRQSAIVEKIRQCGNCRFRDIEEAFPDTSERTLRYDLQSLVEHGFIRRIGSGGPGTSYEPNMLVKVENTARQEQFASPEEREGADLL